MAGMLFKRAENDCIFLAALVLILGIAVWICASRCGG